MQEESEELPDERSRAIVEGRDFYFDEGLMVLTREFLLERGYCCSNGCRHCPYNENTVALE